jgi:hypothetical protein
MGNAFVLEVNLIAALRTVFDLNLDWAIEGFNLGAVSKNGIVQRNFESAVQVIATSRVNLVSSNRDVNVDVTLRPTRETHFALTRELQTQTVLNPGRNVQIESSSSAHSTLPPALVALVSNNLAKSATGTTRLRGHHVSEKRTHLSLNRTAAATDIANTR